MMRLPMAATLGLALAMGAMGGQVSRAEVRALWREIREGS